MVRLTRIYTRTGDGGQTRLVGGQAIDKDALRIEAYGIVDELNAVLGMVRASLDASPASEDDARRLSDWLDLTQNNLFDLGSDLATRTEDRWDGMPRIEAADVTALEQLMDELNRDLPMLESFVIPGGGPVGATLHLARTICRRAERVIVATAREEEIGEQVLPYTNRLSDALFVWSRWINRRLNQPEPLWRQPGAA